MSRKSLSPSGDVRGPRHWKYSSLEVGDMDEVPLINEEDEREEEEEEDEDDKGNQREGRMSLWYQLGGRRRWRQRMKSHSTLMSLLCGGGWHVVWNK